MKSTLILIKLLEWYPSKCSLEEYYQFDHVWPTCRGQAEKEFKVEVEAIGKVRHKNLVGLVGYCAEGPQRCHSIPSANQLTSFSCFHHSIVNDY